MKKNPDLPAHVQFFLPILAVLRKLGGSASPAELKDGLVTMLEISDNELEEKLKTGVSRIDNQVSWSKVYLVRDGLVDTSDPNVWSLTEEGLKRQLTDEDVHRIFKKIHGGFVTKGGKRAKTQPIKEHGLQLEVDQPHKETLLERNCSLPPSIFLCST